MTTFIKTNEVDENNNPMVEKQETISVNIPLVTFQNAVDNLTAQMVELQNQLDNAQAQLDAANEATKSSKAIEVKTLETELN